MGGYLAIFAGLSWTTASHGQSITSNQPQGRASGTPSVTAADIVVTAQRREQRISDVPISVQALDSRMLSSVGARDTSALVTLSPSVTFRQGAAATSSAFNVRGVDSTARAGGGIQPSTALVIDGVPVFRQAEFISELFDIERIEVLRGPQATLFGKNSSAGVISIVNNRPKADLGASLETGATTDGEWFARGLLNAPLSDGVNLRLTGAYRDQRPIVENLGPASDMVGAEAYAFTGKLAVEVSPKLDLLLSASHARRDDSYGQYIIIIPNTGAAGELQRQVSRARLGYGADQVDIDAEARSYIETSGVVLEANWTPVDKLTITSLTGYRRVASDSTLDVDATPTGLNFNGFLPNPLDYPVNFVDRGLPRQPERTRYFSQELRLHYEGGRVDIVGGAFYQRVRTRARNSAPLIFDGSFVGQTPGQKLYSDQPIRYRIEDDTVAVFGDLTFKLTDHLSVFGGLRYTREHILLDYSRRDYVRTPISNLDLATLTIGGPFTATDFLRERTLDNVSGRGGIQWKPAEGQNYYVSYNRGYKGPAADVGTTAVAIRAFTKPEIAEAWEIGTKQSLFDRRLSFSLSAFDQVIHDIQQTAPLPGLIQNALINSGDLKSTGIEFEFEAAITPALHLNGGVAYVDARYDGGRFRCNPDQLAGRQPGCTIDADGDGVPETQDLTGNPAIASSKWRLVTTARYEQPLKFIPATATFSLTYNWNSRTPYSVDLNQNIVEPSHGFLSAALGIASDDGRWEAQLYVRNITNEFYYSTLSGPTSGVGQAYGYVARDYRRFGGLSFKLNY
jgi:iron complex outermembrane receptor protein